MRFQIENGQLFVHTGVMDYLSKNEGHGVLVAVIFNGPVRPTPWTFMALLSCLVCKKPKE